jgi:hypothetical protein
MGRTVEREGVMHPSGGEHDVGGSLLFRVAPSSESRWRCRQGLCRKRRRCNPSLVFDVRAVGRKSVNSATAGQRWSARGALRG